ncbi:X2-like carbohydrate binding domain-containing protein, partial [Actinoplanes sp. NPDC049596]
APAPAAGATPDPWAVSPYMGWSSYSMQVYSNDGAKWINADQLIAQSDAMHAKLQKYGYKYINVDSGWNKGFDGNGRPTPDATLYPDGLQAVIDHVHANGQKFGLYTIPGISPEVYEANLPIAGAPGCTTHDIVQQPIVSADYWKLNYKLDFTNPCAEKWVDSVGDLFGSWGVDFLKFDSVTPGSGVGDLSLDARDDVAAWSKTLKENHIWFELSWDLDRKYASLWREKANGWRIEWDVEAYAPGVALTQWENIARLFPKAEAWWPYTGNGGYGDMDSLNVGNGQMDGMTKDERRTATTLWAMQAAPMYTGNDLTRLDAYGLSLLTNPEIIAINQAATPARPVSTSTDKQVWYSRQPDGSYAVALYNLGRTDANVTVNWSDLGLTGAATVRDLWDRKNLGPATGSFTAEVPIHGTRVFKIAPQRGGTVALNDNDKGVDYTGDWAVSGGKELAASSQPLALTLAPGGGTQPPATGDTSVVTLNDTDPAIKYQGSWNLSSGRGLGDHQDDVHWSWNVGDSIEHTFTGTGIAYLTETNVDEGDVDIYLDGVLQKTVSLHSDTRQVQQKVFEAQGLPSGVHTFKAVLKAGQFMLVDRLDVTRQNLISPIAAVVDSSAPADLAVTVLRDPRELTGVARNGVALRSGQDYTVAGSKVTLTKAYLASLGAGPVQLDFTFRGDRFNDVHWTGTNGAAVSYSFTGAEVSWLTATGPDQGLVDVYLDGKKVKTVDTRTDARLTQQSVFSSGKLTNKKHTIRLVKATGDVMRNDVIRYTVG